MTTPNLDDWTCPRCVELGKRGYCAPGRCYCGHETCHAVASYIDPDSITPPPPIGQVPT